MKIAFLTIALAICTAVPGTFAAPALPPQIRIEVWSTQHFEDPFWSNDPVELFFRVDECAYLTIYQINPWGGVDIIYPRPHHRWIAVLPHRTYSLIDLAADLYLDYEGVDGSAYLGIIATHDPIDLVPWLESGFRSYGFVFGRPQASQSSIDISVVLDRIQTDLRFRIGRHCEPAFFTTIIYLRPRPLPPPVVIYRTPRPSVRIWGSWDDYKPNPPTPPSNAKQHPDVRSRSHYSPPPKGDQREIFKLRNNSATPRQETNKDRRVRKPKN